MKREKASYGTVDGQSYAFRVDGVDGVSFFGQPFGRRLDAMRRLLAFQENAKSDYADAKGKQTMKAVREWVRLYKPTQFYAVWKADSPWYKDDSVQIFYT